MGETMLSQSVADLREQLEAFTDICRPPAKRISTGIPPLDDLLRGTRSASRVRIAHQPNVATSHSSPMAGQAFLSARDGRETMRLPRAYPIDKNMNSTFPVGATIEWLSPNSGSGVMTMALLSAAQACRDGKGLIFFDPAGELYPPALHCRGLDEIETIVIRPKSIRDEWWAWEQSLRSPAVGAVIGRVDLIHERTLRRLQLAAEHGQTLGILLRPAASRADPSWADARFWVEPVPAHRPLRSGWTQSTARRLRITVLRAVLPSRGLAEGRSIEVLWNEETGSMSLAPQLANPATDGWSQGA